MSGGAFQYEQYKCGYIADQIAEVIDKNGSLESDGYGNPESYGFEPEVIKKLAEAVRVLRLAEIYAQRVDWLLSGDDGPESFLRRLADDLAKVTA